MLSFFSADIPHGDMGYMLKNRFQERSSRCVPLERPQLALVHIFLRAQAIPPLSSTLSPVTLPLLFKSYVVIR